jgi:tetratricopeptide (TPR) repeat protein
MSNKSSLLLSVLTITALFVYFSAVNAQDKENKKISSDYISLYGKGNYAEALNSIKDRLSSVYIERKEDYKIPDDYIFMKKDDRKNISELFRKRKIQLFFIEENEELFNLHLYAARCYFKLEEKDAVSMLDMALNHYYESLRYNSLDVQKDDFIFYEISQVYKSNNHHEAYTSALETAYTLNQTKYEYSLELGRALSSTKEKKKAIYHLQRYIDSKGDDIEDPALFITVGNLNEDIGKYLETVKYYKKYLAKKPADGYLFFALGHLAYKRTGDHKLAIDCFDKAIQYLPENEYFRRSKSAEYKADIYMKDLEYEKAIAFYLETKKYHDKIKAKMQENSDNISRLDTEIREIKKTLAVEKPAERYARYEKHQAEKGKIELENRQLNYEFNKLNAGKIRWNLAELHERLDKLSQALEYYNESIAFNYYSDEARSKIKKLKLKIKRGY